VGLPVWAFVWARALLIVVVGLLGLCQAASAHAFVVAYTLPVPFAIYAGGAGAALLLSFVVVGALLRIPPHPPRLASPVSTPDATRAAGGPKSGGVLALLLLALTIGTGFAGSFNPYANLSMTLFWICFVLGVPYAAALFGDFYAGCNPWACLCALLQRGGVLTFRPRLRDVEGYGVYPALVTYVVFIWLELFGELTPRGLAVALLVYTLMNVIGAWLVGLDAWFTRGEFFGVFVRLVAYMAPVARERSGRLRWRAPFAGLLEHRAAHRSEVLFVLFMLSSTAFDGLHHTLSWSALFWKEVYPSLAAWFHAAPGQQFVLANKLYYGWQWGCLVVSPLIHLLVFGLFVGLSKWICGGRQPLGALVKAFAYSLIPIAFAYHVTHYYTLIPAQAPQLLKLLSDPLGRGWDLFGTARWQINPWMINVETIWHTQVALIVIGHVAAIYVAHAQAIAAFGSRRSAALSQLPMLVLMMGFTTLGLWILSLPLGGG
jgi:hypothetical protein